MTSQKLSQSQAYGAIIQLVQSPARIALLLCATTLLAPTATSTEPKAPTAKWQLIDNFEEPSTLNNWQKRDTKNDTQPHVPNPQITERQQDINGNYYLIKKPAAEGVVGNRKALSFYPLPTAVPVGATYTFYTRINVEYFPNNHVFGLSSQSPDKIAELDYNALEPSLRVTDKQESDGTQNNGTLMVKTHDGYAPIQNPTENRDAKPMQENTWYEVWYVVNNALAKDGGQTYDVYIRGGDEFPLQVKAFTNASFRMRREQPLIYFLTNCNTGPADKPYGNGGLKYDDIYMIKGTNLSSPI